MEKAKFALPKNLIAYAGLFLLGRVLEWFKPYLTAYQDNGAIIGYLETKYMFLG